MINFLFRNSIAFLPKDQILNCNKNFTVSLCCNQNSFFHKFAKFINNLFALYCHLHIYILTGRLCLALL